MDTTSGPDPIRRPHGGDGRFVRNPDTAERDAEACRLRSDGHTYPQIATQLGFADESGARKAVERALLATVQEPAGEVRKLEVERLDDMWREVLAVLRRQHVTVSGGKIVQRHTGWERDQDGEIALDGDGHPIPVYEDLLDDGPVLNAVDRLLRIQERRARLLGLDTPVKAEVDATHTVRYEIGVTGEEISEL